LKYTSLRKHKKKLDQKKELSKCTKDIQEGADTETMEEVDAIEQQYIRNKVNNGKMDK
jgi:hypothetical protein